MLTPEDIMRIRRLEQASSSLTAVPSDFYTQVSEFITQEKQRYMQNSPPKLEDIQAFENLKRAILDIYNIREKKVLNKALQAARTGSDQSEHMADLEKEIYEDILTILTRTRGEILLYFNKDNNEAKTSRETLNTVTINILEEVPIFVGPDMKEYGPFKPRDIVELPKSVADLLISRNLAAHV